MQRLDALLAAAALVLGLVLGFVGSAAASPALDVSIAGLKDGVVHPTANLGPVVIVSVKPSDFKVADFTKNTTVNDHEGHIHIYLDDQTFNTMTSEPAWVFGGVKPGPHTLNVELVRNNHTPLSPRVKKTINFTMAKD